MNRKNLFSLFVFLLFIAIATMFLLRTNIQQGLRDLPNMVKDSVLNVVTEYDSLAGMQYELCQYISKRSGLEIRIFPENDLKSAIKGLKNGNYDIIAQNIPITSENRQYLSFTVPITKNVQVFVQRKVSPEDSANLFLRNQIDLAGQTICVSRCSPVILRLKNLSEEIAEPIYIKEMTGYTSEQLIGLVAEKKIDYAVVDKEIAVRNESRYPNIDFGMNISFLQLQAWAVRPTSPILLDSLNSWISEFKK
jgi:ABC-type amino acid transport substrate-binding protein